MEGSELTDSLLALFKGHEAYLGWSTEVEGNLIGEGKMTLGLAAGLEVKVDHLLHEMAHFIEIDDRRCCVHGWGLRIKTRVRILGRDIPEPNTFQASEREMRVIAIQKVLGDLVGWDVDVWGFAEALHYLPDAVNWKYGPPETAPRYGSTKWTKPIYDDIMAQSESLDPGAVIDEWHRKCRILRRRMARLGRKKGHA